MQKISIIIPVYNRASMIARALESVLLQNDPNSECIVVDDGSTDASADVVRGYENVQLIMTPQRGVSAARNTGITNSCGEWIAFLDSDDQWLPGKLARDRDFMQHESSTAIFQSNEIWVRNGVRVNCMKKHEKKRGDIFRECLEMCMISPSSAVVRRRLFEMYGLFDERMRVCEDYDLWLRMSAREHVGLIDTPSIVKFGGHEDQLSRSVWGIDRFRLYALAKIYNSLLSEDEEKLSLTASHIMKKIGVLKKGALKHQNRRLSELLQKIENAVTARTMCKDYESLLQ